VDIAADRVSVRVEIRHTCEQSDGLTSYTYTKHDGRRYAVEELVDGRNNVKLEVSFLKNERGDGWAVRVEGDAIDPCEYPHIVCVTIAEHPLLQLNYHEQA
jgi:hypothetical protein